MWIYHVKVKHYSNTQEFNVAATTILNCIERAKVAYNKIRGYKTDIEVLSIERGHEIYI